MAWDGVLVRFGEIGIKSPPVRREMLERLRTNLAKGMERAGLEGHVHRMGARIWMEGPDADGMLRVATHTFGVVSASPAQVVVGTMEVLCEEAPKLALAHDGWGRFAVRARREGKQAFSSQEVGIHVGSAIFVAMEKAGRPVSVDLSNPEFELHVDIRDERAFLFAMQHAGPGGLPLGAQGRAVILLRDIPSAVAAWLIMRRGAAVIPIHAGDSGSVPLELVDALAEWGFPRDIELLPVCSGSTSKKALIEAAAQVASDVYADVIVTGDRTFSKLVGGPMPLLRPVCGLDEATYAGFVKRIGLAGCEEADANLDESSNETSESLLSMRRTESV